VRRVDAGAANPTPPGFCPESQGLENYMRAFQVDINGKRLCVAGIGEDGVLSAILNHIAGKTGDRFQLSVGGLDSSTDERLSWGAFVELSVGDEIRVEIIETDSVDQPQVRGPNLFRRLTEPARQVFHFAVAEGRRYGAGDSVDTEHLLIALLREPLGWFDDLNIPKIESVRTQVKEHFGEREPSGGDLPLSSQSRRVLQFAIEEADSASDDRVSIEHLLMGLLREEEGYGGRLLRDNGVELQKLRAEINRIRGKDAHTKKDAHLGVIPAL
jgi:ClpA/ClpB-like protein